MSLLAGILAIAALVGVGVLLVAVVRQGRRETKKAEKIMDDVTASLLHIKPGQDGKGETNKEG